MKDIEMLYKGDIVKFTINATYHINNEYALMIGQNTIVYQFYSLSGGFMFSKHKSVVNKQILDGIAKIFSKYETF